MANLTKKRILGKEIKKSEFYRRNVARTYREMIFGWVNLEGGEKIMVEYGKYYIINKEGERSGIILHTNPGHQIIKRLIARWFSTYRKGMKGGQMHHAEYWKSRVLDGIHNINLFRTSSIRFSENRSNFLKLAS
ncbi:hypothetical protein MP478_04540 [Chryseobacterium sp. WG14]|uniref:hypothetical protein n=1 Tax=Chryseobacterium sp. WG14 TaxID=2926909 RepID=UPI00211E87D8|nr:hypothetical protein [Chryseobacterium sp. WG14]MCQ9638648.1 hypothetical protein [Chryseobacterium sp. WG14]